MDKRFEDVCYPNGMLRPDEVERIIDEEMIPMDAEKLIEKLYQKYHTTPVYDSIEEAMDGFDDDDILNYVEGHFDVGQIITGCNITAYDVTDHFSAKTLLDEMDSDEIMDYFDQNKLN
jgi:hypothetical protein